MWLYKTSEKLKPFSWLFAILGVAVMALLPAIVTNKAYMTFTLSMICIYIIVTAGLDILFGYSGQISLGQAGFYAVGAYVSAMLSLYTKIPVFFCIFIGAFVTSIIGGLFAYPASKLVHHFLSMTTIGFGEIARLVFLNGGKLTGGAVGLLNIPGLKIGPLDLSSKESFYYFILVLAVIVLILKRNLINSRIGRSFIAIRENSDAGAAFGINVPMTRTLAFMIASFLAGLGGACYAHLVRFISPETFTFDQSSKFLIMLLLGGKGSLTGCVLGVFIMTFGMEALQSFGRYQMLIYGIILLVVLLRYAYLDGLFWCLSRLFFYFHQVRWDSLVASAESLSN